MSKFYVYSTIPLVLPASRRYGKDKHIPAHSRLVVCKFDGKSCEVKPNGRGNYRTIEVSTDFLYVQVAFASQSPTLCLTIRYFMMLVKTANLAIHGAE